MRDLSEQDYEKPPFKLIYFIIIGIFYFGQGYALTSLVLLLPLYIKHELQSNTYFAATAISAIIIFPWYVKFLWGILSDYFPIGNFGRRKPYLVIATLSSALGWLTLGIHETASIGFISSGLALALGSAIGDAVIDGQAVEITPSQYIGRLQGIAWGSRGLGLGLAGLGSSLIVDYFGWQTMFFAAGFFGISITVIALFLPQINLEITIKESFYQSLKSNLKYVFKKPRTKHRILFFTLTGVVIAIVPLMTFIMERELDFTYQQIGIGALLFALGNFAGAMIHGFLADIFEDLRQFKRLSIFYEFTLIFLIFLEFTQNTKIYLLIFFLVGSGTGAYEAYQLKIIQEETEEKMEGTIFALWTGFSNIGQLAAGSLIIVYLAELIGLSIIFVVQILVIPLIIVIPLLTRLKSD